MSSNRNEYYEQNECIDVRVVLKKEVMHELFMHLSCFMTHLKVAVVFSSQK